MLGGATGTEECWESWMFVSAHSFKEFTLAQREGHGRTKPSWWVRKQAKSVRERERERGSITPRIFTQ